MAKPHAGPKTLPLPLLISLVALACAATAALCLGRYPIAPAQVAATLAHQIGLGPAPGDQTAALIVLNARLPRIIAAMLIGVALSLGGASYQSVFRNPLVSPSLLGVLAGSGFGAALGVVVSAPPPLRMALTFAGGAAAVGTAVSVAGLFGRGGARSSDAGLLLLVFGGLVSGTLFTSLLSIVKFVADPINQLPDIVFWLLGSLANAQTTQLLQLGPPLAAACLILLFLGRYLDVLVLTDDEARSLGLPAGALRLIVIAAATVAAALTVALAGTIDWVGLIVPHIARLLVGPGHRRLMPVCAVIGAIFMLLADTLARTLTPSEIPIGVVADLIGVVLFILVLPRSRRGWV